MKSLCAHSAQISHLDPFGPQKYNSILNTLKDLRRRKNVFSKLHGWMSRSCTEKYIDGVIWNEFMIVNGRPFLDVPYNLGLILNVDWFRPYEHTQYSIGVIYLVIINLPRAERYRLENVISVGCIPGPKEPTTMNSYLKPLVDDLLVLWEGIPIAHTSCDFPIVIRGALLAVSCDIPATSN